MISYNTSGYYSSDEYVAWATLSHNSPGHPEYEAYHWYLDTSTESVGGISPLVKDEEPYGNLSNAWVFVHAWAELIPISDEELESLNKGE